MTQQIEKLLERAVLMLERLERVLPQPLSQPDWHEAIAWRYRKRASGHGVLEAVRHVSDMGLQDLQEIDGQKEKLKQNTLQFVQGLPANNVLLTGSRGTGKSSLIKACLNAYASQGLRLIEVDKEDLTDLPDIVDVVAGRAEKFIIFCDDLSFEDGEGGYKALKSILDGSVAASTPNVLIYATSNRRHLLPEHMKDNLTYTHTEDGEVHPGEVIREEFMAPLGLSANALAKALNVPTPRINDVVRGRRGVSADTAMRLARYFGGDARSWLNLQAAYDLRVAELAVGKRIEREISPAAA